eukprot:9239417-Pyramimonas_sp.AAC.1
MCMNTRGLGAEVAHRASGMAGALKPIKELIAPSPLIPLAKKVTYCESIAASRMFYCSSTWDDVPGYSERQIVQH